MSNKMAEMRRSPMTVANQQQQPTGMDSSSKSTFSKVVQAAAMTMVASLPQSQQLGESSAGAQPIMELLGEAEMHHHHRRRRGVGGGEVRNIDEEYLMAKKRITSPTKSNEDPQMKMMTALMTKKDANVLKMNPGMDPMMFAMGGNLVGEDNQIIADFFKGRLRNAIQEAQVEAAAVKAIKRLDDRILSCVTRISTTRNRERKRKYKRHLKIYQRKKELIDRDLRRYKKEGSLSEESKKLIKLCSAGLLYNISDASTLLLDQCVTLPQGNPLLLIDATKKELSVAMGSLYTTGKGMKVARTSITCKLPVDKIKMEKGVVTLNDADALMKLDEANADTLLKRVQEMKMMKMVMNKDGMSTDELMMQMMGNKNGTKLTQAKGALAADLPMFLKAQLGEGAFNVNGMIKDTMVEQVTSNPEMLKTIAMMSMMGNDGGFLNEKAKCLMEVYLNGEVPMLLEYAKSNRNTMNGFTSNGAVRSSQNLCVVPTVAVKSIFGACFPAVIFTNSEKDGETLAKSIQNATPASNRQLLQKNVGDEIHPSGGSDDLDAIDA